MKWKIFFLALVIIALFMRFYRLDESSHFLFDESRDLMNIHQIWTEKKLTLVGPISEDRSHANSSLTYYMLLPFAVLFRFDPISTAIGAVFWGMMTAALLVLVVAKYNPKLIIPGALLAVVWVPLVVTARWAWNPNILMFWFFAGMLLYENPKWYCRILSGIAFGLTIHHHNLAVIPVGLWILVKRDWKVLLGVVIALMPFVIFDLRHPPGIFITRMIDYNRDSVAKSPLLILTKVPGIVQYFFEYIFQITPGIILGMIGTFFLAGWDIYKKGKGRIWLFIWIGSVLPLAYFIKKYYYFLPALPFFVAWVVTERTGRGKWLGQALLILMIIGSAITVPKVWHELDWEGNLKIVRGGTNIMKQQITEQQLKNPNLAVLASPDIFTNGHRYRFMLLVNEIRIKPYEDYQNSDNLFVVTKGDEKTLRKDPALEMMYFKNGPVKGVWNIPDTDWRVVQFNKY